MAHKRHFEARKKKGCCSSNKKEPPTRHEKLFCYSDETYPGNNYDKVLGALKGVKDVEKFTKIKDIPDKKKNKKKYIKNMVLVPENHAEYFSRGLDNQNKLKDNDLIVYGFADKNKRALKDPNLTFVSDEPN